MKFLVAALAFSFASQAFASDYVLYEQLSRVPFMQEKFGATRTQTGIDFKSNEKLASSPEPSHSKYHVEIEGLLPIQQATSIQKAAELVAAAVKPEVDASQEQENAIVPGVNVDFIDINGAVVALLSYKASTEDNPYRQRLVILAKDGIYTLTMSLHSQDPKDKMGIYLFMLAVAMINSNEIELAQS